ncbi:hypothetical protein ABZ958_37700 [Streptomyces sp. NPDC046237]
MLAQFAALAEEDFPSEAVAGFGPATVFAMKTTQLARFSVRLGRA